MISKELENITLEKEMKGGGVKNGRKERKVCL